MKAHWKFFCQQTVDKRHACNFKKGLDILDNLWYNNCLKCQPLSIRTCNSFQSRPVHLHFDRSKITNQVTNNNLRGMGVHNNLLTKNQGISWMFFPIL